MLLFYTLGNLTQETLSNGLTFSNIYDSNSRRIKHILPDSSSIEYTYLGFYLHTINRDGHSHTYEARNLEEQITHILSPAGSIHITRDPLGRYMQFSAPHYSADNYSYDPAGNLSQYNYHDRNGGVECHYCYDDLDQLIEENEHTYSFDSIHNRLQKDMDEYEVNALCQVTHDGDSVYIYDTCGNLISDGVRSYTYDSLDRLISVEEGSKKVQYTYDPFHRRLSKTSSILDHPIKHTRYMWDGDNEIGAVDRYGTIRELRILGEGLGAEVGAAILYELNGTPYIPIHDHRGCVVTLIDLYTQTSSECYRYTAFGEEQTNQTLSPWRFSSKRVDKETSLVYFGRRYYNPNIGRWITQDPLGFDDGPNLYAYVKNCPLTDCDPYGLYGCGDVWRGTLDFFWGPCEDMWSGICGAGQCISSMGQWMYADFQYEYFDDRSFFEEKSLRAVEGWKNLGRAVQDDPMSFVAPGIMEAKRNPTSPAAWGKAAMDVVLIGFSAAKIGRAAAGIGRIGRISEEFATVSRSANAAMEFSKLEELAFEIQSGFKKTLPQQAEELVKLNCGKNSVTIGTPTQQIRYDLVGRAHGGVPTPHMQVYNKNFINGVQKNISRASKQAIPMSQEDMRLVKKRLKRNIK